MKASEVGNHHECRLGHWADSMDADQCRSLPAFRQLEAPHKQVHDLAREVALAFEQNNKFKAGQLLEKVAQASQEVFNILQGLQREC